MSIVTMYYVQDSYIIPLLSINQHNTIWRLSFWWHDDVIDSRHRHPMAGCQIPFLPNAGRGLRIPEASNLSKVSAQVKRGDKLFI